jgi:hypothetical protein
MKAPIRMNLSLWVVSQFRTKLFFLVSVALAAGLITGKADGDGSNGHGSIAPEAVAFARYNAILQQPNPLIETGPVAVKIDALLSGTASQASLFAIRDIAPSERGEYEVLHVLGDPIVFEQVIRPYLLAEMQVERSRYPLC